MARAPETPIRAELFSIERLEQHAESLATAQQVAPKHSAERHLLPRVKENGRVLKHGYRSITKAIQDDRPITPAAEWLVDNFHIVEDQIREILDDLPPGFYRDLPKLADGFLKGTPRVYGVAWAFVAHTDSRFDPDWLRRFARAYQRVDALHIGEIWALAISLRIVLVENLRRITESIMLSRAAREEADDLADLLLGLSKKPEANPAAAFERFKDVALPRAFAVQLVHRLRDQGEETTNALRWLDQRLATQGVTAEDIVRLEHQEQTAMNTTVRNVITSMRLVSSMDWAQFFEDVAVVDDILRAGSDFAAMDFPSRDLYRHAIEELARRSSLSETEIARKAVQVARQKNGGHARFGDPGYYLISAGRAAFENEIGFQAPLKQRFIRLAIKFGTPFYLGAIAIATAIILGVPLYESAADGLHAAALVALGLLGLIPASDVAVALVNCLVTHTIKPQVLPKLEFSDGVPAEFETLVAIPTLLTGQAAIDELIERLEIHYLSNPDGYLRFALLTDWIDASQEKTPDDDRLLASAADGIRALNEKYGPGPGDKTRFFLFHRRRLWNAQENRWLGWERKRGKLHELNRLLRGDTATSFIDATAVPANIRYVITLDTDTNMSRGAARKLVGAMAHPLNRPRLDPALRRVVEGYGVMQPRVTPTLPREGFGSLFQQTYSGPAGIDPYAFAVSDVYQDLFKEGSYIGKGIYDVDTFEAALAGRVPDNTMLSHDLFEGSYARTALLTDIEMFEEYPSNYEVAVARDHRWARGDWQLLPWLIGPGLPLISRWKIVDNLRRSLSAPTLYLAWLCCWLLRPFPSGLWINFLLAAMALPSLLPVLIDLLPSGRQISIRNHLRGIGADVKTAFAHFFLAIVFMAHRAFVMSDAVARTLFRLNVSRRHMLEWTSAAVSKNLFDTDKGAIYKRMRLAPLIALLTLALAAAAHSTGNAWRTLVPFVLLWLLSPWVAQRISVPLASEEQRPLSEENRRFFRRIARKTWRFFETFVTLEHHFLPPDNFQEIPEPVVAHRTSPTNIGLYLLSVIAARDFGWLGATETVERLEATMTTIKDLPKLQGHLYNWYDTHDLRPLDPHYISTVDSGNLAGHLWTLANALREMADRPLLKQDIFTGIDDIIALILEAAEPNPNDRRAETVTGTELHEALTSLRADLQTAPGTLGEWSAALVGLKEKAATLVDIARTLTGSAPTAAKKEALSWSEALYQQIASHARDVDQQTVEQAIPEFLRVRMETLAETCDALVAEMDFRFLLDPVKKIFSIGYQVGDRKLDPSYYDLLASEARLASFVAIAKGDVPSLHWFHLSRSLTPVGRGAALLSWSGSMFEYLMPSLVMRPPGGSLLDQTCRRVVRRQIEYGGERGVPWGMSEAGMNVQNLEFTYQYGNFGIPGLGLKRGLSKDLLIAPYATALAAMVDPLAAAANFKELTKVGAEGRYGYYEALDYTPERLTENQKVVVVQEFMSHHQGMSLVSLTNVLFEGEFREKFHARPMVQASELLLQERTPRDVPMLRAQIQEDQGQVRSLVPLVLRRFHSPHDSMPRTHLLSNGRYSVMITAAGSGYSRWKDLAVTRWVEDSTQDNWGTYFFLRDVVTNDVWSAGFQPTGVAPDKYEVDFSEDRAEIVRHDGFLTTTLEVVVSPEDDAEIRRITIKNSGSLVRDIEVTSYAEVVLARPAADQAHPAFSNLFVQTEFVPEVNGLICTRRPRSPEDASVWAAHVMVVDGETTGALQYESDRARFLGRGRSIRSPLCVMDGKPLSNTAGAVLDPVMSLRRRVHIQPGETVRVIFTTLAAESRKEALELADKYHDLAMFERTVMLAWTQAHVQQHYLGLTPSEAHLYQDLASRILYSNGALRPSSNILKLNRRGAPGLWAHGISGDMPILLVRIDEVDDSAIVREVLRAHEYWRMKHLAVDLVILNEKGISYTQELQNFLEVLVKEKQETLRHEAHAMDGDIFVLRADQLSTDDRVLLQSAARVVLLSRHGTLSEQLQRGNGPEEETAVPPVLFRRKLKAATAARIAPEKPQLQFFNGIGGFSPDGREYVTVLGPEQWTPAPWINVIANPNFGFHVSECGSGSTWALNSRENHLTPWSNDPVSDPSGEIFYIRDEETGDVWTPTALPIREDASPYTARHGQGYSQFEYKARGVAAELLQFVPVEDPVKISRIMLTNESGRTRRLSVTAYVEWALAPQRSAAAPFIITEIDAATGAVLAQNPWNTDFAQRVAFADFIGYKTAWTADRTEFIGRNGTLERPAGLERDAQLSGKVGAGLDPCAAMQRTFTLAPGAQVEIVFVLGQATDRQASLDLLKRIYTADVHMLFNNVMNQWNDILGKVQVRTPDRAMDLMLNHWLLYQTLVCRLWARSGFYQAGGAYGFRDQLQDVMALMVSRPDLAREQILRAAHRQFPEGDVQHWWHPPSGRGVRTKISDDLIWLPYVLNYYLEVTKDAAILEEKIPFLESMPIPAGNEDAYFQPVPSAEVATLYEHCARIMDRSLEVGEHGLPLMGTGDWNDGMNRVGHEGKGESVWLAWFLHAALWEFAKIAEARGDAARAEKWRLHVGELKTAVERHGWDGEWYRRAYFDDGTPLGSALNTECRIDSIAQSWSVLSGAADPARAARAMAATREHLIKRQERLVLLFSPPFDHTQPNPGYIQGYVPGVRENGGQYTHAAVWVLLAFAALGDGNMAGDLFSLLNPINHGNSRTGIQKYKVEPYVMTGDTYSAPQHTGRGGWTWYTGSAGWMYRAGTEGILGFRLRGNMLFMDPCVPAAWNGYDLFFRFRSTRYEVKVENPSHVCRGVKSAEMDGKPVRAGEGILLNDDGAEHRLRIVLG